MATIHWTDWLPRREGTAERPYGGWNLRREGVAAETGERMWELALSKARYHRPRVWHTEAAATAAAFDLNETAERVTQKVTHSERMAIEEKARERFKARVRLHDAADDMLDALEAVMENAGVHLQDEAPVTFVLVRNAIAKARGTA